MPVEQCCAPSFYPDRPDPNILRPVKPQLRRIEFRDPVATARGSVLEQDLLH